MSSMVKLFINVVKDWNRGRIKFLRKIRSDICLTFAYLFFERKRARFSLRDIYLAKDIGLIMIGTGLGDAVVMSGLIKILRDAGKNVFVICNPRQRQIFSELICIDGLFIVNDSAEEFNSIKELNISVDVLIDCMDPDQKLYKRIWLMQAIKHKYAIGFNQRREARFFDINILRDEIKSHWSDRLVEVARSLGIEVREFAYDLQFSDEVCRRVNEFTETLAERGIIIFNPVASDKFRSLSLGLIKEILSYLCQLGRVVIAINVYDKDLFKDFPEVLFNPFDGICENFYLVSKCSLLITVDTSLVHVGNFFKANMICIYNNRLANGRYDNNVLWGPNYSKAIQVFSLDNCRTETGDDLRKLPFSVLEAALKTKL